MKPISNTAFYCCGVRMQDAARPKPICGDNFAKAFMDERGLAILEKFKDEKYPSISSAVRHRIIDDMLRAWLGEDPRLTVIIIGAGFDSRAFRLPGGSWIEVDEPQVIEYKNARLAAAAAPNPLTRIPIDFANESLEAKLAPYAGRDPVAIVIEGVFMYLADDTTVDLLRSLQRLFPRHRLVCDLMTRRFFEKYSRTLYERIQELGASFAKLRDAPAELFIANGYRILTARSIVAAALRFTGVPIPEFLAKTLLRRMTLGYRIFAFEFG